MLSEQLQARAGNYWQHRYTLLSVMIGLTIICVVVIPKYLQGTTDMEPRYAYAIELQSLHSLHERRNVRGALPQPSSRRYSCLWYHGGIGNLLFQFASVFGLSQKHNASVILGEDDSLYKIFKMPSAAVRRDRNVCDKFVTVIENKCCSFNSSLTHTSPNINYLYIKYLQSWKYFANVSKALRTELTFRPSINESAAYIVDNYRYTYSVKWSTQATVVGIHIRRGDILDKTHNKLGFKAAPTSYLHHAIDYFLNKFEHVIFIVCSNDMKFTKDVLDYRNITVEYIYVSAIIDLAILSQSDHVIITVGSFGWWAGFLSKGIVVYYKYPMTEGSKTRQEFKYEDYFLPEWIGLE